MITPVLTTEIATTKVQVELSSHVLSQLLKSGLLHGGDCKCLNASAKKVIWQAILATITDNKESHLCA
ncbi:MAG: hypothetical protein ACJAXJ_001420 [Colwellia sp.]|jgi:hypothetical protein